jgi:hypothetical protein
MVWRPKTGIAETWQARPDFVRFALGKTVHAKVIAEEEHRASRARMPSSLKAPANGLGYDWHGLAKILCDDDISGTWGHSASHLVLAGRLKFSAKIIGQCVTLDSTGKCPSGARLRWLRACKHWHI